MRNPIDRRRFLAALGLGPLLPAALRRSPTLPRQVQGAKHAVQEWAVGFQVRTQNQAGVGRWTDISKHVTKIEFRGGP